MARAWTDEQRAAFRDKMAKARADKKNKVTVVETVDEPAVDTPVVEEVQEEIIQPTVVGETVITGEQTTEDILKRAIEAIALLAELQKGNMQGGSGAEVSGQQGKLVGTTIKYSLDKSLYPDPCERLANEPRLARFAFKENYELAFSITTSEYTTVDHIRMKEPKFILKLIGFIRDDEDEEVVTKYLVSQQILHEDPESAIIIARDNNINVDSFDERDFLNEMRYLMMRDWLLEVFYPKRSDKREEMVEMVVGGKIVQSWTAASSNSTKVDFDKIDQMGGKFRG